MTSEARAAKRATRWRWPAPPKLGSKFEVKPAHAVRTATREQEKAEGLEWLPAPCPGRSDKTRGCRTISGGQRLRRAASAPCLSRIPDDNGNMGHVRAQRLGFRCDTMTVATQYAYRGTCVGSQTFFSIYSVRSRQHSACRADLMARDRANATIELRCVVFCPASEIFMFIIMQGRRKPKPSPQATGGLHTPKRTL